MEKFDPNGRIGMLQEFVDAVQPDNCQPVGRYLIRGLAGGRHPLYIRNLVAAAAPDLDSTKRKAALQDLWDLGKRSEGKVYLVIGYIPPEPGEAPIVHVGNR